MKELNKDNIEKLEKMSREAHINRHIELHKALDELIADFIDHSYSMDRKFPLLSETSISTLMSWSFTQTKNPTEKR